ncbi:hypothetical protein D3C86_536330 [compost metagenome]
MRARSLAILLLGLGVTALSSLPASAAEKTIGRQVQTWRPRPLRPLIPETPPSEIPGPSPTQAEAKRPAWEAWITHILNGQPLIIFQPAWKGTWPAPQNPWSFTLTPGLRGNLSAGFGAEVALSGAWTLMGLKFEGGSHLLWAETSSITSWRAAVSRGGLSLECRGWFDDAFRPGDLSATAALRRSF